MKKTIKNKEKSYNPITFFTTFFVYFLIGEILIIVTGFLVIRELSVGLPGIDELERIPDAQELSSVIYSDDNVELKSFREEINRYWVEYNTIPQCMIDAVTSTEDSRFFSHWGVSLPDILRAAKENIIHLSTVQGASTITQ
ncbi:MAG TPA: transglycosylase domain-containing protein, partial [Anaerolineae bacterium]|nr:transglycosylase domain-containing protein [Anaerolineae bacterium]